MITQDTVEVVKLLVRYCDVNVRDKYASTPLHFCAMRGNVTAARTLLQQQNIIVNVSYISKRMSSLCTINECFD